MLIGPGATEQDIAHLRRLYGLDEGIGLLFVYYPRDLAGGNFGTSISMRQDVLILTFAALFAMNIDAARFRVEAAVFSTNARGQVTGIRYQPPDGGAGGSGRGGTDLLSAPPVRAPVMHGVTGRRCDADIEIRGKHTAEERGP